MKFNTAQYSEDSDITHKRQKRARVSDRMIRTEDGPHGLLVNRRHFIRLGLAGIASLLLPFVPRVSRAFPPRRNTQPANDDKGFVFAQIVYRGGIWNPEPTAVPVLLRELEAATSVEAAPDKVGLRLSSPELYSYPFLYMTGNDNIERFQDDEVDNLRKYLKHGGTLVGDDSATSPGYGFDAAFRREMKRVFPDRELKRLPSDHTVYRSFFMIRGIGGRKIVSPFLEGINLGGRTPVIYCSNGMGSAWAKDQLGRWKYPTVPGGERQRKLALQMGINMIMYALCSDYKQDRIHLPFLRQKI